LRKRRALQGTRQPVDRETAEVAVQQLLVRENPVGKRRTCNQLTANDRRSR
jgi:hypothetical protein